MKSYDKIKKDIMECESAMEMAGYLKLCKEFWRK